MSKESIIFINGENLFETLQLTLQNEYNIENIIRIHNFPIIFLLIFFLLNIFYFILNAKNKHKLLITLLIILSTIPLSYLFTKQITQRTPSSFKDALKYDAQYNLIYSYIIKNNKDISYLIPKTILDNEKNIDFNKHIDDPSVIKLYNQSIKHLYFNEKKFKDPLSNQTLNICSIFMLLDGKNVGGDLSNNKYTSISWNQHDLKFSCKETAKKIIKFIDANNKIEISPTEASIFEYNYPDYINKDSNSSNKKDNNEDDHHHDHEDHEH